MSLIYRGTSSDDVHFNVTERRVYNAPAFDVTGIEVPGRSGDILNSQERFKNKAIVYTGFIRSSDFPGDTTWERLSRGLRTIKAWICGDAGKYHDLTDDYDPGFVRRAFVSGETAISEVLDRPDGATITITFMAEPFMYEESDPIELPETGTASGAIASFEGVAAPLQSLKFNIEPSQDLHGYSYPWPDAGNINKLPSPTATSKTVNGITIAVSNGVYSISGTATALAEIIFDLPSDVTYDNTYKCAFLNTAANSGVTVYWRYNSTNGTSYGFGGGTNRVAEYSSSGTFNKVRFVINSGTAISGTLKTSPVLCLKSVTTPTSFIPYSNISPISGWSQVDAMAAGKNLAVLEAIGAINLSTGELQTASSSTYARTGKVKCLPNTAYTASGGWPITQFIIGYYDANDNYLGYAIPSTPASGVSNTSFTTHASAGYMVVIVRRRANTSSLSDFPQFQLEEGSVASPYAAPTITPITIALGQTVYGGTVDALAGKCYARPYYASYSGQALVGPWISSHDKYVAGGTPTTGAQVVDMGGTETTLSLTPVNVSSLLGQNNIWCNTGDTEVVYVEPTENPTEWPSKPRLEITMSGAGTLTVNGKTWSIGAYTGTLICDSEIMDWYDSSNLKNFLVSGDGFPEFQPGENVITYTGGITKVVAKPRWRTL